MFQTLLTTLFFIASIFLAAKALLGVIREKEIFSEYGFGYSLIVSAILVPFSILALISLPGRLGWLPALIISIVLCTLSLLFAYKNHQAFDTSGTSRTKNAAAVTNSVTALGILGIIYIGLFIVNILINTV